MLALELEADGTEGQRLLWGEATALVPADDPSTHNQALMELGALVCTPTNPKCELCPWTGWCEARAAGTMEAYPRKRPKRAPRAVRAVAGLVTRGAGQSAVLLARRPAGGLLGGLWELPGIELGEDDETPAGTLEGAFRARLGMAVETGAHLATVTHQFTHRTLTLELFRAHSVKREVPVLAWYTDWRWVPRERADDDVPLSTLAKKVLAASRGGA
jgi:A/G-specific adenine glycosylase